MTLSRALPCRSPVVVRLVAPALVSLLLIIHIPIGQVSALTKEQKKVIDSGIYYFNVEAGSTCTNRVAAVTATATNLDHAGQTILTDGQLQAIKANQAVYEQAASQVGIPWQMIAVIHVREHGLQISNPGNGQGIYQFLDKGGGPYPPGPVSQEEFLRQSILAATFIKGKAGSNYAPNRDLDLQSRPEAIKDTFFSYNGRAKVYEEQARAVGFNDPNQGYEGSPYVMNKADAKRDPVTNPTGWGQIKKDRGPIEYPANGDYGAYVQYAALTGTNISGGCNTLNGTTRDKVVTLAKQELALWQSGQLVPGNGYQKYSQGRGENWCADFVSWIYNQAGYPLKDGGEGNVPAVVTIKAIGQAGGKFTYHDAVGYTPRPGDIAIHLGGDSSHVNFVVGVSGNQITTIGGNQGGDGTQGSFYNTSSVTQYTMSSPTANNVTGYVSPD